MTIKNENPPMLKRIFGAGMNPDLGNVIFTYGDTIYNPSGRDIPDYLIEHESVHTKQQGDDPKGWWERYLNDPYFRFEQEVEGYARQFAFMCNHPNKRMRVTDRNKRHLILMDLGNSLSGPTYNKIVKLSYAMQQIKKLSGVR